MKATTFDLEDDKVIIERALEEVYEPAVSETPSKSSKIKLLFWGSLTALFFLIFSTWLYSFIENLFTRSPVLGWVGASLGIILLLISIAFLARELWAMRHLKQLSAWQSAAKTSFESDNEQELGRLENWLTSHFKANTRSNASLTRYFNALNGAVLNNKEKLSLFEREVLAPLDKEASALISQAAKRVSVVTALSPRAFIDVAIVIYSLVTLLKKISISYGLRPTWFGTVKLFTLAFSHLALTAGMAIGDTVLSQVFGAGVAARVSAKFGEGVVNGFLTARFGLAALAVCRPMPFLTTPPVKLKDVASGLISN